MQINVLSFWVLVHRFHLLILMIDDHGSEENVLLKISWLVLDFNNLLVVVSELLGEVIDCLFKAIRHVG